MEKSRPFGVSAQSAVYTPGAPFRASIVIPLSSARAGKPVSFEAECAFIRAFPINVSSVSIG